MRAKTIRLLLAGAAVVLPLAALAESDDGGDGGSRLEAIFWNVLPFLIFAVLLFWVFRRQMKSPLVERQQQFLARHEQHMERVEALLERLVRALEEKR